MRTADAAAHSDSRRAGSYIYPNRGDIVRRCLCSAALTCPWRDNDPSPRAARRGAWRKIPEATVRGSGASRVPRLAPHARPRFAQDRIKRWLVPRCRSVSKRGEIWSSTNVRVHWNVLCRLASTVQMDSGRPTFAVPTAWVADQPGLAWAGSLVAGRLNVTMSDRDLKRMGPYRSRAPEPRRHAITS